VPLEFFASTRHFDTPAIITRAAEHFPLAVTVTASPRLFVLEIKKFFLRLTDLGIVKAGCATLVAVTTADTRVAAK
jgi:hypothetical protein